MDDEVSTSWDGWGWGWGWGGYIISPHKNTYWIESQTFDTPFKFIYIVRDFTTFP